MNPSARVELTTVGLDEAGKGDYFGPLVVAAVAGTESALRELGVVDSKKTTDKRAIALAAEIHTAFSVEVVAVLPPKYNELYRRFKNLNTLLAWCHARALENLLERVKADTVIADQFASPHVLQRALMERGKEVELVQKHRAEANPVVAAASLVARAEFVTRLDGLARKWQIELPKGAGPPVDDAGREVLKRGGIDLLTQVAKLHFKNSKKIGADI